MTKTFSLVTNQNFMLNQSFNIADDNDKNFLSSYQPKFYVDSILTKMNQSFNIVDDNDKKFLSTY